MDWEISESHRLKPEIKPNRQRAQDAGGAHRLAQEEGSEVSQQTALMAQGG